MPIGPYSKACEKRSPLTRHGNRPQGQGHVLAAVSLIRQWEGVGLDPTGMAGLVVKKDAFRQRLARLQRRPDLLRDSRHGLRPEQEEDVPTHDGSLAKAEHLLEGGIGQHDPRPSMSIGLEHEQGLPQVARELLDQLQFLRTARRHARERNGPCGGIAAHAGQGLQPHRRPHRLSLLRGRLFGVFFGHLGSILASVKN
jgi:hypothetical protein